MREFFRGWRRKVGCVALVLACGLTGLWARSSVSRDQVRLGPVFGRQQVLWSEPGELQWLGWTEHDPAQRAAFWKILPASSPPNQHRRLFIVGTAVGHTRFTLMTMPTVTVQVEGIIVPYWSLVLPLTLVSAYLLLWKPRQRTGLDHA